LVVDVNVGVMLLTTSFLYSCKTLKDCRRHDLLPNSTTYNRSIRTVSPKIINEPW